MVAEAAAQKAMEDKMGRPIDDKSWIDGVNSHQEDLKLYAIIRGDLNMPPGKLAAQAGHAYTNSYLKALEDDPQLATSYETYGSIGTKVCLKAKNLEQLLHAQFKAEELGIPHSLITDSGHVLPPHFDGSPIITALGIGPYSSDQIKLITRKFNLL